MLNRNRKTDRNWRYDKGETMTKEDFMKSCLAEYRCMPDAAECWCSWADTLHECDSAKADPETGEVEDGEGPVITAEEFLDQFMERLEVMAYAYGIETVTTTLNSGCYFPWEMMQAGKYIWLGGNPSEAQRIATDTGKFEETTVDQIEYNRLKWELERSRIHRQGGLKDESIRSIWRLIDRMEQEFERYKQSVLQQPVREIFNHSTETAAKESLLNAFIDGGSELKDGSLYLLLEEKEPLDTLYQFLLNGESGLSAGSPIRDILARYNESLQGHKNGSLAQSQRY